MKYIETTDQNGNKWSLKTVANAKYPHKRILYLYLNDKSLKVMNFVTIRECEMFWDLLKSQFKGDILEVQSS